MLYSPTFTAFVIAAAVFANAAVVPTSHISLPFAKRINTTGARNIIEQDRARIKALRARTLPNISQNDTKSDDVPVTNTDVSYIASVGVGSPPTFYNLIVDTGSSNTWVGANRDHPYVPTSSSVNTGDKIIIEYGSGAFAGEEYTDTVTIGSLVIKNQGVGAAIISVGFDSVDGILGLGPVDLTEGTLSPASSAVVPTVVDTAFSQGLIPSDSVAVSFEPTTSDSSVNGELTFGGVDSTKFTGTITYTPITTTSPASEYWGIDQSISYGPIPILPMTAGIVDTGTTLLGLSSNAYSLYQAVTGAIEDPITGLLMITPAQYDNLQDLVFTIGGTQFSFTPNAQIWPRSLNAAINGTAGGIYLVVMDLESPTGSGLDFINGQVFLERFYSVFDTANKRVGIATTSFTTADTN